MGVLQPLTAEQRFNGGAPTARRYQTLIVPAGYNIFAALCSGTCQPPLFTGFDLGNLWRKVYYFPPPYH